MKEMLEKVDVDKFCTIIESAVNEYPEHPEKVLGQWASSKERLFEMLGGLTYEEKFEEALSFGEISNKMERERIELYHKFPEVVPYFDELIAEDMLKNLHPTGKKISKFLSEQIIEEENYAVINEKKKTKREAFNIRFSKFYQSLFNKGIMVISIDPLDFLTMSHSKTWHSCHSTTGMKAAATVSYMVDSVTVVAYIKSREEEISINGVMIPHHNKTWRQLVHVDLEGVAVFNRQHPNQNDISARKSREMVAHKLGGFTQLGSEYTVTYNRGRVVESAKASESFLGYDDLHWYDGDVNVSRITLKGAESNSVIYYGCDPYCPVCGSVSLADEYNDIMFNPSSTIPIACRTCCNAALCDMCEETVIEFVEHGDQVYCSNCFEEYMFECECCYTLELREESVYVDCQNKTICSDCFNKHYIICDNCSEVVPDDSVADVGDESFCRDCAAEILVTCEECEDFIFDDYAHYTDEGWFCLQCFQTNYIICAECNEAVLADDSVAAEDEVFCSCCAGDILIPCEGCRINIYEAEAHLTEGGSFCEGCHREEAGVIG